MAATILNENDAVETGEVTPSSKSNEVAMFRVAVESVWRGEVAYENEDPNPTLSCKGGNLLHVLPDYWVGYADHANSVDDLELDHVAVLSHDDDHDVV